MTKHIAFLRYNRQPQGRHAVPGSISTIYLPPACVSRNIRFFYHIVENMYIKMHIVRNFRTTSRGLPSELMKCTTGNMTRSRRAPPQVDLHVFYCENVQVVSYLPLSHVAGTFIDIYLSMWGGGTVHFADKMALQGTLLKVT